MGGSHPIDTGATTLDSYIASPDGGLDWLVEEFGKLDYGYDAFIAQINTVVIGRRTYDQVQRQFLDAGGLDRIEVHVIPLLLGDGSRRRLCGNESSDGRRLRMAYRHRVEPCPGSAITT